MKRTGIDVVEVAVSYLAPHNFNIQHAYDEYELEVMTATGKVPIVEPEVSNQQWIPAIEDTAPTVSACRNLSPTSRPRTTNSTALTASPLMMKRLPSRTKTSMTLQQFITKKEGLFCFPFGHSEICRSASVQTEAAISEHFIKRL